MSPSRIAGSRPVTLPTPAAAAEAIEAKKTPKPPRNATTFEPSRGVQLTDGRLSATAPYAKLPSDLKSKLSEKVWKALPEGQRSTLLTSYQSLKRYGVWDHVAKVTGQKELREAHVKLPGGAEGEVAGNSGAIQYEIRDRKGFTEKLTLINPKFGVDGGLMGAMHPGQTGLRESNEATSLHISLGPGDSMMDAHIDKVNPTNTPKNGMTQMDLRRGLEHWSTEVLPELLRKATGIPGLIVKPELRPGGRDEKTDVRLTVNFEVRGPVEATEKKVRQEPMEGSPSVPDAVMQNVAKRLASSGISLPLPKGLKNGEQPDRDSVAAALAAKIQQAVENGDSRINLDLVQYAGLKGLQQPVVGDVRRIADIVRSELEKAGVDVSGVTALTVTFGSKTEGETVSLRHND